jgi:NAD(P)-dependent dehydrogenase (short-subunit alcohol dehydrogenase family)
MFDLSGRRALVTGASRGIGRAIASGLASAGAAVALGGRSEAGLADAAAEIERAGGRAVSVLMDARSVESCRAGVEDAAARLGGLDILVNNAGIEEVRPSVDVDEALWDRILDTNLKGAFFAAQAFARLVLARGGNGSVVNLCSLTSEVGVPTAAPYGSSKSGLLGLTRALSSEWSPKGIRVNAIAPGYFRTALTDVFYASEAWQKAMLAKIPMGRFGRLEDLVGVSIFLASDASAYVTGQMIAIDGGYLASI